MAHLYFAGSKGGSFQNLLSRKALSYKELKGLYNMNLGAKEAKEGQKFFPSLRKNVCPLIERRKSELRKRFQTPKLNSSDLCQNGENCFAISLFFPFLDLLMVVARIFLRIKAKNDGWGGVRRISNILGQILVHYYCCIGTKPSFHGAVDSISNFSYLIFIPLLKKIKRQKTD